MINYTGLIGSLITALVAIFSVINNNKNNAEVLGIKLDELEKRINLKLEEQSKRITQKSVDNVELIFLKVDTLEKRVDKHNDVIERTYALERDSKTAFKLIDELKEEVRK